MNERASVLNFTGFVSHAVDENGEVDPDMTEPREVCFRHEFLEKEYEDSKDSRIAIVKAANDVSWIKMTGYALLVGFATFLVAVFGLFYPAMTKLADRQAAVEISLVEVRRVQAHVIDEIHRLEADRKEATKTGEHDRKEIRQYLETLRRGASAPPAWGNRGKN